MNNESPRSPSIRETVLNRKDAWIASIKWVIFGLNRIKFSFCFRKDWSWVMVLTVVKQVKKIDILAVALMMAIFLLLMLAFSPAEDLNSGNESDFWSLELNDIWCALSGGILHDVTLHFICYSVHLLLAKLNLGEYIIIVMVRKERKELFQQIYIHYVSEYWESKIQHITEYLRFWIFILEYYFGIQITAFKIFFDVVWEYAYNEIYSTDVNKATALHSCMIIW